MIQHRDFQASRSIFIVGQVIDGCCFAGGKVSRCLVVGFEVVLSPVLE